jgi:hypothetical protein
LVGVGVGVPHGARCRLSSSFPVERIWTTNPRRRIRMATTLFGELDASLIGQPGEESFWHTGDSDFQVYFSRH